MALCNRPRPIKRAWALFPLAFPLMASIAGPAWAGDPDPPGPDPFSTARLVPPSQARGYLPAAGDPDHCRFGAPGSPLGLVEVVERALCHNPRTRLAWANAKTQAAALGLSQSAYLPTVTASLGLAKQRSKTRVSGFPALDSDASPTLRNGSLKMTMVLADWGLRRSNVDQARALLDAANATHDAALQAAFIGAGQRYFDTLTALATLDAAREAEKAARESLMAADAKYKAGVGGLTDQLQANTAYAQAKFERVVAEGQLKNAQGELAVAIGLPVHTPLTLSRPNGELPDTSFVKPVEVMIEDARRNHPSLVAAQAEIAAAEANVKANRAEGGPSLSLATELGHSEQLDQPPILGLASTDTRSTSGSIGLQLNIPLFEGFGRSYRIQSAQGQVEAKRADYVRIEEEVLLEVWRNYQRLVAEAEGLKATEELVGNARTSFNVARGRYRSGVGNIVELLNVQSAMTKAEQQRIETVSNWHAARLKLAASVGQIGLWAIHGLYDGGDE